MNVLAISNGYQGLSNNTMKAKSTFGGQLSPLRSTTLDEDTFSILFDDEALDLKQINDNDLEAARKAYKDQQRSLLRTLGYVAVTGGVLTLGLLKHIVR